MTRRNTSDEAREVPERGVLKSVRFTALEAQLLEESAAMRNMTQSEVVRAALIVWRQQVGDRQRALDAWVERLIAEHGPTAPLTARVNDVFSLDVEVDGAEPGDFMAQAVFDRHDEVQLWIGDPVTDARVCLGRVRAVAGAAITMPLASLKTMGADDAHAV